MRILSKELDLTSQTSAMCECAAEPQLCVTAWLELPSCVSDRPLTPKPPWEFPSAPSCVAVFNWIELGLGSKPSLASSDAQ